MSHRYQPIPLWEEFHGGELDEVGEYREPTPERREKIENGLERLAEVFAGADFPWTLDGAVNISLYRGRFMRDHKDLDISVFSDDLHKLESLLKAHSYGLFVSRGMGEQEMLVERVRADQLEAELHVGDPNIMIITIDAEDKIARDVEDPINYSDLHVHVLEKEQQGILIHYTGMTLPKRFFEPIRKELPSGKSINLSQPGIVAYHKLHANRAYDRTDLGRLRPYLREEDFRMLKDILPREKAKIEQAALRVLREIWDSIADSPRNPPVISEKIFMHPEVAKHKVYPDIAEYVSSLSQFVATHPTLTFEEFSMKAIERLPPLIQLKERLEFLDELERDKSGVKQGENEGSERP